jgi:hypothetical protein
MDLRPSLRYSPPRRTSNKKPQRYEDRGFDVTVMKRKKLLSGTAMDLFF